MTHGTYLDDKNRIDCCGCESCRQICPKNCIKMEILGDGFSYPTIKEEQCVKCHLCRNICPISEAKTSEKPEQDHDCYYGWHNNETIRRESTSGGAFSAIAELILEEQGSIYGAMYGDDFKVCHTEATNKNDLRKLRQSKYVQSEIGDCYIKIKEKLSENKKVLFCGTPCQVHGLSSFLQKKYHNLILVDFICHGVTSPSLFNAYLKSLEKRKKSKVNEIRFRDNNK